MFLINHSLCSKAFGHKFLLLMLKYNLSRHVFKYNTCNNSFGRQTDIQYRLFDPKIYKLHMISVQIDDQETATKTKFVAIVTATLTLSFTNISLLFVEIYE